MSSSRSCSRREQAGRDTGTVAEANRRTRETLLLAGAFALYWPVCLALDSLTSLGQQLALGCATWAFLLLALRLSPPAERVQVASMVAVATCVECVASLLLGAYRYRLDNLPMYVPPGHGLFFLVAVRLAGLPYVRRHGRAILLSVFALSAALAVRGLLLPTADVVGLGTWVVLVPYLLWSPSGVLYAISFVLTMILEFYGTTMGNWAWATSSPILGLPAGNPPAAIGVGYCVMDGLARLLAPRADACARLLLPRLRPTWLPVARTEPRPVASSTRIGSDAASRVIARRWWLS